MKKAIYVLLFTAFFACNEKVIEKPENLISKDQMALILYDLAIINAAKTTNPQYLINRNFESMPFIYRKYGIDSVQFVRSDIYYASIPDEYESIYKVVEARLELEKNEVDQRKTRISDSIRRIADEQRNKISQEQLKTKEQDTLP